MSKFVGIIIGGALIATGVFLEVVTFGASTPLTVYLITAGVGMVISGIGTLLAKGPMHGVGTAQRNPIAPWTIVFGRAKVGGTIVYIHEFDENNKYLDLVIVLASHPCESVDALLLDGQRVRIDPATKCSFTPTQQDVNISSISRSNGVVTVVTSSSITDLQDGDQLQIHDVGTDATMNGKYSVTVISGTSFSYVCGGDDGSGSGGKALTLWPDYKAKIYMESLLGDHAATFTGILSGTPYDGDTGDLVTDDDPSWTADHKLLGKTCVFLRLHYNDEIFANGLPSIAFHIHGKNDIYDPRDSSYGYSENPALCIADYLSNTTFGFKAVYGTEIPTDELSAQANICDENVDLASGGTEPRYTCNGSFPLTMKRGEVLQNLLTSMAGRLTYVGGQFFIHAAAWEGIGITIPPKPLASATISIVTAHTLGVPDTAVANAALNASFLFDGGAWTKRTDTGSLDATDLINLGAGNLVAGFSIEQSLLGDASPPDTFLIYDCFIDVVYADASTATFRPSTAVGTPGPVGTVTNAANAIDGSDSTYATITRSHFSPLGTAPVLALSGWGLVSSTDPPDTTPEGFTATGISLANAAGPFRWRPKLAIRDLFNGVKGTYISPTNNWQSSDIPPYAQDTLHGYASGSPLYTEGDANLAADGGDRRWKDIQLPFTISVTTAQRLCKIELMRIRQQGTGTFVYNMAMYQLTALDVVQMTLPVLGWTNKMLEVAAHRFTLNKQNADGQEVTLLGTEIDVQETDPSIYDWDITEELSAQGFQHGGLPTNRARLDGIVTKVNPQTGTTYTIQQSDRGRLVTIGNASAVAVTLPKAGEGKTELGDLWNTFIQNTGAGLVTITPAGGSTIDGAATLTLSQNMGVRIFSNGTNFYTERGSAAGNFIDNETPAGTSPLTAVYTLAHSPAPASSLHLYVNGVRQIPTTDYSLSGATITFVNAPDANDIVRADYRY